MADSQYPNNAWQNRPPLHGISQAHVPGDVQRPSVSSNMQIKSGQPFPNGPGPTQQFYRPPVPGGVNGLSSQGQNSAALPGMRPPTSFPNGPNVPPSSNGSQFAQPPRPGMPPLHGQGQFRPSGPPTSTTLGPRPPMSAGPPAGLSGQPRMPPPSSQPMATQPQGPPRGPPVQGTTTPVSTPVLGLQGRPNELPVPFHGQGQYSHQIGMTLTPGITPANSAPPSQKTSRTNSPAVMNQNFDALEGQFRGTPEQEQALSSPQSGFSPGPQGPPTSLATTMPISSLSSPTGMASQPRPGPTGQQPMSIQHSTQGFTPQLSLSSARPGMPPPSASAGSQPGHLQRPGFPPATSVGTQQTRFQSPPAIQQPRFPIPPASQSQMFLSQPNSSVNQVPGFPPQPQYTSNQVPRFPPQPQPRTNQVQGFPPQPHSKANQVPGFPPPPQSTANQVPGFPPPPHSTANQVPGFPPPPHSTANQVPGFPPPRQMDNQRQGFPQEQQDGVNQGSFPYKQTQFQQNQRPGMNPQYSTQGKSGSPNIDLLQQKKLLPPEGLEIPKPTIPNDNRSMNCNPEVFRCTMNAIPQTSALLNKSRLPLGILIHPFKDLSQLPVIQSSVIVRCRSCRTYINPFVTFVDSRRWKCNLCYRVNELPDEFSFDPVTKTYGDPQRRPEVRSATIEFIAPSEYMLRPPQPAVYLYLLDVSFNAIETGYLSMFCETLLDVLERIPGDGRTQIGFVAYDSAVHFFNLAEGLSQPQMLTVTDVDDIFLPCPDDLLVNLNECRGLVIDLLNQLPTLFENNMETRSALGAALQTAYKMTSSTGGRVTVMQTVLPTYGPGALQNREDPAGKAGKDCASLGPATDFYKKLALDCSAQQIAVDLFMFNGQYADMASIECISKYSGGCTYYYPSYHVVRTPHYVEKYEADLRRYMTRKVGFESVMRIRCSKGISIHTFHGNFFVRSTDLLSLPNVNPDAGFGMQMSIEEPLTDMSIMSFQAALLYTSSKGERRIRVHTLCLPVTNQIADIHAAADQQAIVALLAKMAVDRSLTSSISDAREAIVNAAIDTINTYGASLQSGQRTGGLVINDQLRLIPLYCLALLKCTAFRTSGSTRLDDRTYALQQCKVLPVGQLIQMIHPDLYPLHTIMDVEMKKKGSLEFPDLPLLQLSSANIDRYGAYLLDVGDVMYLYVGGAISEQFCRDMLDVPNFASIREGGIRDLPDLDNDGSERLRSFINYLLDGRSNGSALIIVRPYGQYFVIPRVLTTNTESDKEMRLDPKHKSCVNF
ncbi:SC24B-like protein [Mya arenaria]|uniref:SC24B-like protein n=1 Tax=Mya arenaria TaxID=6604 RepID=A0ABY7DIB1_MYAAR|nr:SC24B-like protein [Mya arenaria]